MSDLSNAIDDLAAATEFSGVVRIDRDGSAMYEAAHGMADRGHDVPNTVDTVFGIASGAKTFTAMTVMSLVEDGTLTLDTSARSLLGADLQLIDDAVTIEHLLSHRSGIGDYLDEDEDGSILDYVMPVPVHRLAATDDYLSVLDGHPTKFPPNTSWSYCNGGFVVLALLAERATGEPFHDLVHQRVCVPAGLTDTAFSRSDELDGDTAVGYLEATGLRSNVLHLPVCGSGDGGIHSTLADIHRVWDAFVSGRIVSHSSFMSMTTPRDGRGDAESAYGLGLWLRPGSHALAMEGYDAGVSFRSICYPDRNIVHTVIANWSDGAWPITKYLEGVVHSGTM